RTMGSTLDAIPFGGGPIGHRWILGVQFGGVILAAVGATAIVRGAWRLYRAGRVPLGRATFALLIGVAALVALYPALSERAEFSSDDRLVVRAQQEAFRKEGADLFALIDRAKRLGGARIYAGTTHGLGPLFEVGYSPVYEEIFDRDAPGIGYTGRAATLSTDPEHAFDPAKPDHWDLFGVGYYILPDNVRPAAQVPAEELA